MLAAANSITGVSDRESDIYEHFATRPPHMDQIVRACQNRKIETDAQDQAGTLLFSFIDGVPEQGRRRKFKFRSGSLQPSFRSR